MRPLARPEVDRVEGVPPTVALEQKLSHGSRMSTVGTASEVYHYLRLLFAWVGTPEEVARVRASHTANFLRTLVTRRTPPKPSPQSETPAQPT